VLEPDVSEPATDDGSTERSGIDEGEAWRRLQAHLTWSDGPTVSFVFATEAEAVRRLRQRAIRSVKEAGSRARIVRPDDPQELREVVRELMSGRKAALVWLEAMSDDPPWLDAWDDVLQRLNERRERLRRSLGGALIVAGPPALKSMVRNRAPDLWSIRSVAADLAPNPGSSSGGLAPGSGPPDENPASGEPVTPDRSERVLGRDRRAERSNAYRTAEAVLRFQFHHRMRTEPWFALVVGDDPVPRRRLLDALLERGHAALVHSRSSRALTEPTPMDVHWVLAGDEPDLGLLNVLSASCGGPGSSEGRQGPSRPVVVEGPLALEQALARHLPDLYASVAFVVRLHVERALHPGPLPVLDRTEELVRDVWEALDRARTLEDELGSMTGRDEARGRADRIRELSRAAEALLQQGWSNEAAPLAGEILRSADSLRPSDPNAPLLRADGEELCGRIASHQGDLVEAAARYGAALPVRRRLARTRGVHRLRRRAELARCLSVLGEFALWSGHTDEAETHLREALAIRRRLARATDDRSTLSELAMAWSMVGDLELARHEAGDRRLKAATDAYIEALRLREQIALEEDAPRFRRLLSVAHGRLARVYAQSGDWQGSRREAEQAVAIAHDLCRHDPSNVTWRIDASVASSRLGDATRALGDLDAAAAAYAEAVELRQRLLAEDPENARWQDLLAVALGRLVEVRLVQEQLDAAEAHSLRATELSEQLTWLDPGHLRWRRGLAVAWIRRGDVARARGKRAEATEAWRRALSAAFTLADAPASEGPRRARELLQALEARGVPEVELAPTRARIAGSAPPGARPRGAPPWGADP
jgi:tetratricopeptide (TPR) repeat protein